MSSKIYTVICFTLPSLSGIQSLSNKAKEQGKETMKDLDTLSKKSGAKLHDVGEDTQKLLTNMKKDPDKYKQMAKVSVIMKTL